MPNKNSPTLLLDVKRILSTCQNYPNFWRPRFLVQISKIVTIKLNTKILSFDDRSKF